MEILNNCATTYFSNLDGKQIDFQFLSQEILQKSQSSGQIVSFHMMIQNVLDPEYFVPYAKQGNNIQNLSFVEQIDMNLELNDDLLCERIPVILYPIPYQNQWATSLEQQFSQMNLNLNNGLMAKVYDPSINFKLNSIVEVTGFLYENNHLEIEPSEDDLIEQIYINFPRIHALKFNIINVFQFDKQLITNQEIEFKKIKQNLFEILTSLTQNDKLSILILYCLIQNSQISQDEIIGRLILNITNTKDIKYQYQDKQIDLIQTFQKLFEKLIIRQQNIQLNINYLQQENLRPIRKQNLILENNQMQIIPNTFILIDETKIQSGKLNQQGYENLQFIQTLLEQQQLIIDFQFFQQKLPISVSSIIFSQSKSILYQDVYKKWPNQSSGILPIQIQDILFDSNEQKLNDFRSYIIYVQQNYNNVEISEECAKNVEQQFVQQRQNDSKNTNEITLHRWISIMKFLSCLSGQKETKQSDFILAMEIVKYMESI